MVFTYGSTLFNKNNEIKKNILKISYMTSINVFIFKFFLKTRFTNYSYFEFLKKMEYQI